MPAFGGLSMPLSLGRVLRARPAISEISNVVVAAALVRPGPRMQSPTMPAFTGYWGPRLGLRVKTRFSRL